MESKIKSRLDVESPKLLKKIEEYIKENDQTPEFSSSLQIVKQDGKIFFSGLSAFDLVWNLCFNFDQYATCTIQHGDMALINEDGSHNSDTTPNGNSLSGAYGEPCWYNACVSERISNFSRSF